MGARGLTNEGRSGRTVEANMRRVIAPLSLTIGDLICVCARARARDSFGSNGAAVRAIDIPDWTKIQPGSVTQNWKHFTRRGPRRHVSRIRSNKLRGIGNRRRSAPARECYTAQNRARLLFPCPRVYVHRRTARYTGTPRRRSRLCYRSPRFARQAATDPTRVNDA